MDNEILLIDGVGYGEWTSENEPNDFEPVTKYHIKDIFGDDCNYLPKISKK